MKTSGAEKNYWISARDLQQYSHIGVSDVGREGRTPLKNLKFENHVRSDYRWIIIPASITVISVGTYIAANWVPIITQILSK